MQTSQITLITSCRSVADLPASGLNLRAEKSVGFAKVGRMTSPSFTLGVPPSKLLPRHVVDADHHAHKLSDAVH